jgi:hypothetical protein
MVSSFRGTALHLTRPPPVLSSRPPGVEAAVHPKGLALPGGRIVRSGDGVAGNRIAGWAECGTAALETRSMRAIDTAPAQCPTTRAFPRVGHARVEPAAPSRRLRRNSRAGADNAQFAVRAAASHRGRIVDLYV